MSTAAAHSELRVRYKAQIGSVPVAWPNVPYTPVPGTTWTQFNVLGGKRQQLTVGATQNSFRNIGVLVVQVFAPLDKGDGAALELADIVAALFNNWCGTVVRCREASIRVVGPDGHGWYQVNVTIPFQWDELI